MANLSKTAAIGTGLVLSAAAPTALALTPELARTCRDMALQTYPYQLPGTGPGNAQNQIRFYKECVAKNGDIKTPATRTPTPAMPNPPPADPR